MRKKSRKTVKKRERERFPELGHALQSSTKLSVSKIMKPQGGSNAN